MIIFLLQKRRCIAAKGGHPLQEAVICNRVAPLVEKMDWNCNVRGKHFIYIHYL